MVIVSVYYVGVILFDVIDVLFYFKNVKCRMEIKGNVDGIIVYDDFVYYFIVIVIILDGLWKKVGYVCILVVLEFCFNIMKMGVYKDMFVGVWY